MFPYFEGMGRVYTDEELEELKVEINLEIPSVINKAANLNDIVLSKKAYDFIDKSIKEEDVLEEKLSKAPFVYNQNKDKIIVDTSHPDFKYYNFEESIIHEIAHLKDIRNNITNQNLNELVTEMNKAKMYLKNNYTFFRNFLKENESNMTICDIMSVLSDGNLLGDYGHSPEYWKNDVIRINELSANLISAKIIDDVAVRKLLKEIPPLNRLMERCVILWQV